MSKNEDICCEVQKYFGSSPLARFTKKVLSAFSRYLRPEIKPFLVEYRLIQEVYLARFVKFVLVAFSQFIRPKTKMFSIKFRCIFEPLHLQSL